MNISKRYAWQSVGNCRETSPLLPQSLRGLVIGKSGCGKTTVIFNLLLQPAWLDYNHLYIFGKNLHQQEERKASASGKASRVDLVSSKFPMCSTVKKCCSRLSLPLKNTVVCVMERYELTFTMIVRIF